MFCCCLNMFFIIWQKVILMRLYFDIRVIGEMLFFEIETESNLGCLGSRWMFENRVNWYESVLEWVCLCGDSRSPKYTIVGMGLTWTIYSFEPLAIRYWYCYSLVLEYWDDTCKNRELVGEMCSTCTSNQVSSLVVWVVTGLV